MTVEEYQRQGTQMTPNEFQRFVNGIHCGGGAVFTVIGSKVYATCDACNKLIRINKPFFGSLHLCK